MSIDEASQQIMEEDVWDPVYERNIPSNYDKKYIIPAIFIVVEKTKNGMSIYKGRLCAGFMAFMRHPQFFRDNKNTVF